METFDIDVIVEENNLEKIIYKITTNYKSTADEILEFQQIEDLIGENQFTIEPTENGSSKFFLTVNKKQVS